MSTINPLERRRLGGTDMEVTAVSLGGAGLGGIFGPVGDADGVAAVETALELGINYLDTSPKYGDAERKMGLALRGVPRDSFYLSSKVGTHPDKPGDYSAETAAWTVERSLEVLGVDFLDLCHIHEPEPHQLAQALGPGGAMETLVKLKDDGVIRSIGIGVRDHTLHRQAVATGHLDVCMMVNDYTLMRQEVIDMFALADEKGLGLVNGAALAMGLLSGRDPRTIGTPNWTPAAEEVRSAERVHEWCAERELPVLALALQFSLRQSHFDCTLIGASTAAEVSGCWEAIQFDIPESTWVELPTLLEQVRLNSAPIAAAQEPRSSGDAVHRKSIEDEVRQEQ
ncbi:MAG: aldo/keto reductase [Microbacteriaceae bacterium]|nr:aldo/keto reductase [Microbacteriaceae bacterium]